MIRVQPSSVVSIQLKTDMMQLHKSTLTKAMVDGIVHNRIDIDMGTENFRIK